MSEPLPITVVSTADPVLRDSTTLAIVLDAPAAVALSYTMGSEAIRRTISDISGVLEDEEVRLEHICLNCALREDVIPTLQRLAALERWSAATLALPVGAEPQPVAEAIAAAGTQLRIASVVTVADLTTLEDDLLGDDLLADRGYELAPGDDRAVAEALAHQIEYADVIITPDRNARGHDLLDHIRSRESQHWSGLHGINGTWLFGQHHDPMRSALRNDPRNIEPALVASEPGGPTWTLDLHSSRPFHPARLMASIERLASGRIRSRGRFWLPTRPDALCIWDGAGGQLAIGDGGTWVGTKPSTRLVITGTGNERSRLRNAFTDILLTPAEMSSGLSRWAGIDDGFDPWLGGQATAA
ncbi:GTP-binding protein [Phytoactinopolyspora mesophila]|uniref:GTP-binding protein n=1 Tax=Phytoactinopolyspora mesophila TaxID=2650750 RepID=UPI0013913C43